MSYYIILPFIGFIASGIIKYSVNYFRYGRMEAKKRIGNGGFPSTHTTVISAPLVYILLTNGWNQPILGVGCAVLIITVIDATGTRRTLGRHARILNELLASKTYILRERQGHTWVEVLGGCGLGFVLACMAYLVDLRF